MASNGLFYRVSSGDWDFNQMAIMRLVKDGERKLSGVPFVISDSKR